MKNLHEGLTPESVEVELVELRFVWGRGMSLQVINHEFWSNCMLLVHHDNRDLELLPNFQPAGVPSIDNLTSIGGAPVSVRL